MRLQLLPRRITTGARGLSSSNPASPSRAMAGGSGGPFEDGLCAEPGSPSAPSAPTPAPASASASTPARNGPFGLMARLFDELGLVSLRGSHRDVKLVCLQRLLHLFAHGAATLVQVEFLGANGLTKTEVGLFMTLTMVGDVCLSLTLTVFADGIGRRRTLALAGGFMALSGLLFATCESFAALLLAAILGVVSPSGKTGPFRAVEESVIAHLTPANRRSDIFAWYNLVGAAGGALGMMTWGWVVHYLTDGEGWTQLSAFRVVFYGFAAVGLLRLAIAVSMSRAVEFTPAARSASGGGAGEESARLLGENESSRLAPAMGARIRSVFPRISRESVSIAVSLAFLFAMDSLASGLAPLSWIAFFLRSRHHLEQGVVGSVFSATSIISACSMVVSTSLAKRFGNVNTMVFTHLPSSIFLILLPLPDQAVWALILLLVRSCTMTMDAAPRTAFLAEILLPAERTAIMGTLNLARTGAQSLGPLFTGILADQNHFWVSFVCAGGLKVAYDIGLLILFKNYRRRGFEEVEGEDDDDEVADDDSPGTSRRHVN